MHLVAPEHHHRVGDLDGEGGEDDHYQYCVLAVVYDENEGGCDHFHSGGLRKMNDG